MKHTIIATLLASTFLLLAPATAVTLVNPSFEDLDASYVDIPGADRMDIAAAPGWVVAFNSPDWFWGEGPAGLWNTPFGDHFALGAATGTGFGAYREGVSQSVSGFIIGELYEISFSHANGLYFNPGPDSYEGVGVAGGWQVAIDGASVGLASSTNDNSVAAPEHTSDWQSSSVTFVATAPTHDVQFVAFKPDGLGQDPTFQFLDTVDVSLVPEPSRAALAMLGLTGVLMRRRRD